MTEKKKSSKVSSIMKIPDLLIDILDCLLVIRESPIDEAKRSTKSAIKHYINSTKYEPCTTYESKHLINLIADYHAGRMPLKSQRIELRHILCTRIFLHSWVNSIVIGLGLNNYLPRIEEWQEKPLQRASQLEDKSECRDLVEEQYFRRIYWIVVESGVLNIPPRASGHSVLYYQRPARYLATCMCLAKYSEDDVKLAIEKVWECYDPIVVYVWSHEWKDKRLGIKKIPEREKKACYRDFVKEGGSGSVTLFHKCTNREMDGLGGLV